MEMAFYLFITIVLSVANVGFAIDVQCPEEGCGNLTIYLGPKWGSKVVILPHRELGPMSSTKPPELHREYTIPPPTTRRHSNTNAVLTTNTVPAIYKLSERFLPTDRWKERFGIGVYWTSLNLTGIHITDFELKDLLSGLTGEDRSRLQYLYLGQNNITSLKVFTFPLESERYLKELSLDNNPILQLSFDTLFEISRLHALTKLNLSHCSISYLDCPYSHSLQELDLSHNRLEYLPTFLDRLPKLNRLILDNNKITYMDYFPPTNNLRYLSVSNNYLSYLGNSTFESLRNLYELRLDNNLLEDITQVNTSSHTAHYLNGNHWECSCPLIDKFQQSAIINRDDLTCLFPGSLSPRLVNSLSYLDVSVGCQRSFKGWLQNRAKQAEDVERWFRRHGVHMSSIYNALLLLLLVVGCFVVFGMVLRHRQGGNNSKTAPAPPEVPYTILDDKMLA